MAQIKNIVITRENIDSINGLLGLLSTVSLNTEMTRIDIYGPKQLYKYIFWGRKYSETNFRYKIYIHSVSESVLTPQFNCCFHASINNMVNRRAYYCLISAEQPAAFNSSNASKYAIPAGPLRGFFKTGQDFILPDGLVVYNINFIHGYYLGDKIMLLESSCKKLVLGMARRATYIACY